MHYSEIKAKPPLNRFVECFWTLAGDSANGAQQPERILPDGCVELILNFADQFSQHDDGEQQLQPRNLVVGQMTGPILISPTGRVQLLGIRFHPGGTVPFFGVPMYELTDRLVELGSLASELESNLVDITCDLPQLSQKIEAVENFLARYLLRYKYHSWTTALAGKIVDQGGLISIDQLATDAGISSRQLERRFQREVGLGPKLLSRILRFQQVFRAVERCDGAWAPVALECGYYDQAHLIRDFNQFAGQTPSALFAEQSTLTESFTRKSRTE